MLVKGAASDASRHGNNLILRVIPVSATEGSTYDKHDTLLTNPLKNVHKYNRVLPNMHLKECTVIKATLYETP